MFFCHFGRREPHLGGPGPHFEDFWDYCDFGGAFATKYPSLLESKMQALTHFFQCCCLMFFWVLVFLNFCDFECPETLFWLPFWLHLGSPGPLKNSWKCVTVINFRGLTLPDSIFLHVRTMGAFWEWYFDRFMWFWAVLRLPFWDLLVPFVVKKEVWKNDAKSVPKGECKPRGENRPRGCGSLKTRQSDC